jgi:hypothetical protein
MKLLPTANLLFFGSRAASERMGSVQKSMINEEKGY